jgi:hypothetical protein
VRGVDGKESDRSYVTCGCWNEYSKGNMLQGVKEVDQALLVALMFVHIEVCR